MFEESINILHLSGGEKNILEAEDAIVKIPRTGIFICSGGWVNISVDGANYHVVKDSMVVYFAYSDFHIQNHSAMLTGILIGGDLETVQPILKDIYDFDAMFAIKQNPLVMLSIERVYRLTSYTRLIEDTIERIKRIEETNADSETAIPSREILLQQRKILGQCLMLEIISCFTKSRNSYKQDKRGDDVLKNFMEALYKNFKEEHEVSFYAQLQNLTSRYFSAVIKERSGQTPSVWISTALLAESKQMLQASKLSVGEISDALSFPNQSYFGKWFKNHTGISPLEFKNGKAAKKSREVDLAKFMPKTIIDNINGAD